MKAHANGSCRLLIRRQNTRGLWQMLPASTAVSLETCGLSCRNDFVGRIVAQRCFWRSVARKWVVQEGGNLI